MNINGTIISIEKDNIFDTDTLAIVSPFTTKGQYIYPEHAQEILYRMNGIPILLPVGYPKMLYSSFVEKTDKFLHSNPKPKVSIAVIAAEETKYGFLSSDEFDTNKYIEEIMRECLRYKFQSVSIPQFRLGSYAPTRERFEQIVKELCEKKIPGNSTLKRIKLYLQTDEKIYVRAELHAHSNEDPWDKWITHSSEELIDFFHSQGVKIMAISLHVEQLEDNRFNDLREYAKSKSILLIPAVELNCDDIDCLVYNSRKEENKEIKTFKALAAYKEKKGDSILINAPHPFIPHSRRPMSFCIGNKFVDYHKIFDTVEYCYFYNRQAIFSEEANVRAVQMAASFGKTVLGSSDTHKFYYSGNNYSLIGVDNPDYITVENVFWAIRNKKVKLITRPMPSLNFLRNSAAMAAEIIRVFFRSPRESPFIKKFQ